MARPFKRVQSQNRELNDIQSNIQTAIQPLLSSAIAYGTVLTDIAVTTAGTAVDHGLNRNPLGYIVIGKDANADVWDYASILPERLLMLRSSANVTINLWVF